MLRYGVWFGATRQTLARVIRRAGERRDFPFGQLGREPLQTDVRKTDGRHRAAKIHRARTNE